MSGDHGRIARIEYLVLRVLARLPAPLQVRLSGEPPVVLDGQTLDPTIQLIRAIRRRSGTPGLIAPDHVRGRRRFRREMIAIAGPETPVRAVRDVEIPTGDGVIRARHYTPDADGPAPLLVLLHGGGFVIGDLETNDPPSRLLCAHAGVHVLSVDYRLAPEHPFPAAIEDARAALGWAREHADALGADPERVLIGGDSAGANLATVAARLETREGRPPFAQLLIYPPTDSTHQWPSHSLFGTSYFLDATDRDAFARHYVAGARVSRDDDRVSPLLAPDLGGLPPALVVIAGFDVLRDEGEAYADALRVAGTRVRVHREPGLPHGFVNMIGIVPAARDAMLRVAAELRRLLQHAREGVTSRRRSVANG